MGRRGHLAAICGYLSPDTVLDGLVTNAFGVEVEAKFLKVTREPFFNAEFMGALSIRLCTFASAVTCASTIDAYKFNLFPFCVRGGDERMSGVIPRRNVAHLQGKELFLQTLEAGARTVNPRGRRGFELPRHQLGNQAL